MIDSGLPRLPLYIPPRSTQILMTRVITIGNDRSQLRQGKEVGDRSRTTEGHQRTSMHGTLFGLHSVVYEVYYTIEQVSLCMETIRSHVAA